MKLLISLPLVLFAVQSIASPKRPAIVGGVEAERGEFPQMVSLQRNGRHFCGGTLIDKQWVLSAAHCVSSTSGITLRVGLYKQGDLTAVETFGVEAVKLHPSNKGLEYDFALLKLKGESKTTPVLLNEEPIEIPDDELKAPVATTAGWGATSEGGSVASILRKVEVPLVSASRCERAYPGQVSDSMICAGYDKGGKDSCQGDSGGPLYLKSETGELSLVGVVSWGEGCARPKRYGVYAQVDMAVDWIRKEIAND